MTELNETTTVKYHDTADTSGRIEMSLSPETFQEFLDRAGIVLMHELLQRRIRCLADMQQAMRTAWFTASATLAEGVPDEIEGYAASIMAEACRTVRCVETPGEAGSSGVH